MVEWGTVRRTAAEGLESARKSLESCDHNQIEYYRGRIAAFRRVLQLEDEVRGGSVPSVAQMNVPSA